MSPEEIQFVNELPEELQAVYHLCEQFLHENRADDDVSQKIAEEILGVFRDHTNEAYARRMHAAVESIGRAMTIFGRAFQDASESIVRTMGPVLESLPDDFSESQFPEQLFPDQDE